MHLRGQVCKFPLKFVHTIRTLTELTCTMNKIFQALITLLFFGVPSRVLPQELQTIVEELGSIHTTIRNDSCSNQKVISNRAMNLFLSDKIGTYLSGYKDLSFYKNNVSFNAASGEFSLNHNMFQAKGLDNPVRSVSTVGVKANVTNAIASAFTDQTFTNQLGMTITTAWIQKPKTTLNSCAEKNMMDAQRETLLELIKQETAKRDDEFAKILAALRQGSHSDADFAKMKLALKQEYFEAVKDEVSRKFAQTQYLELARSMRYKKITTNWTSVSVYLPIILERFLVANSIHEPTKNQKLYPFEFALRHTRLYETKSFGRIFLKLEANLSFSGVQNQQALNKMNLKDYIDAGGADSFPLRQRSIKTVYVGKYETFLTPAITAGFVYFPPNSHIGVSSFIEQNIGKYSALNWTLGIPVVLINTIGAPAANFEFKIRYFDISHSVYPGRSFKENISVNFSVGVPFSKIIY